MVLKFQYALESEKLIKIQNNEPALHFETFLVDDADATCQGPYFTNNCNRGKNG